MNKEFNILKINLIADWSQKPISTSYQDVLNLVSNSLSHKYDPYTGTFVATPIETTISPSYYSTVYSFDCFEWTMKVEISLYCLENWNYNSFISNKEADEKLKAFSCWKRKPDDCCYIVFELKEIYHTLNPDEFLKNEEIVNDLKFIINICKKADNYFSYVASYYKRKGNITPDSDNYDKFSYNLAQLLKKSLSIEEQLLLEAENL